jgi:RNA polymerase sigma-70 factor (ECF subfamily)
MTGALVEQARDLRVDERTLIDRVLAGDAGAARALYDAHVDRVYRLAFRLTGDEDLARDCTQDAFVRAFERLADFRGASSLATWLHSVTVSTTLNAIRKRKRWWAREAPLEAADGVRRPGREAEPDLKQRLARAIDALPEIYRTVFVMYDVEGFTHEEIGGALGVPIGTSKARLSTARAKLRQALADFAGDWAS